MIKKLNMLLITLILGVFSLPTIGDSCKKFEQLREKSNTDLLTDAEKALRDACGRETINRVLNTDDNLLTWEERLLKKKLTQERKFEERPRKTVDVNLEEAKRKAEARKKKEPPMEERRRRALQEHNRMSEEARNAPSDFERQLEEERIRMEEYEREVAEQEEIKRKRREEFFNSSTKGKKVDTSFSK